MKFAVGVGVVLLSIGVIVGVIVLIGASLATAIRGYSPWHPEPYSLRARILWATPAIVPLLGILFLFGMAASHVIFGD